MLHNSRTQAQYDVLPADVKAEYAKVGDAFILQHDEPAGELKRAKDREKERADGLVAENKTLSTELNKAKNDAASTDSPASIRAAERAAVLAEVTPKLTRGEKLETALIKSKLNEAAGEVAKLVGGDKNKVALLPHVVSRLDVKLNDKDEVTVTVLGADGKPTAKPLTDLATELRADANLASLVVVKTGSGTLQNNQTPTNVTQFPASGAGKPVPYSQMTTAQKAEFLTAKNAEQQTA